MDKYLIALDLDGTLLTDDKKITPKTRDYLNALSRDGHHIVIATGRPLRAAYAYQQELGVNAPIVSYNGALSSFPGNNNFPKRVRTFDRNVLRQIVTEIGYEILGNLMVETEEHVYLLRHDEELNTFFWNDRGIIHYGDPFSKLEEDPLTLIFLFNNLNDEMRDCVRKVIAKFPGYYIRFWHLSGYAELYQDFSTKKEGIEHIAKYLNVPHSHIIAAGDAENDKEMLGWANHSIWMINGVPSVRDYAKMTTTEDNNNDGLVSAIKRVIK
ncbi:MAG: HAD family hydrolase [Bacilli bacterium]|nr:HAD family hydrolase [Bacilli bacterium]